MEGKAAAAMETLERGLDDAIAVLALPAKYRRRLRTTNMLERLIRIFPNSASAHRLVGALLQEQHEEWLTGRRYFDMREYFQWKKQQQEPQEEATEGHQMA